MMDPFNGAQGHDSNARVTVAGTEMQTRIDSSGG
jgi:hypothetical protein